METQIDTDYDEFMEEAERIFHIKGFELLVQPTPDDEHLVIFILKDDEKIGSISIVKKSGTGGIYDKLKEGSQTRYKSKNISEKENDVFSIPGLDISEEYRGHGLGILLLIYGISFIKHNFNYINYVTLDDASDQSTGLENNIYNRIGFTYTEQSSMDIMASTQRMKGNKLILYGPEKQLLLQEPLVKMKIRRELAKAAEKAHKGGRKKNTKKRKRKYKKSRKNIKSKKRKYK